MSTTTTATTTTVATSTLVTQVLCWSYSLRTTPSSIYSKSLSVGKIGAAGKYARHSKSWQQVAGLERVGRPGRRLRLRWSYPCSR